MSGPDGSAVPQSFGDYLIQNLGVALWLLPVLAWYEVLRDWSRSLMSNPDTLWSKVIQAIVITIVVFLIFALFNRMNQPKPSP